MKLIHCHHVAPTLDHETTRRCVLARATWAEANIGELIEPMPLRLKDLPRRFQDGDREMAYVKDIITEGIRRCHPGDMVLLTNEDACLNPDLRAMLCDIIATSPSGFSGPRRDFVRLDRPLTPEEICKGAEYTGTDIFVIQPAWWYTRRDWFPDMVHGAEMWDHILRGIMRIDGLVSASNLVFHEVHESRWTRPENRHTLPSQRHNQTLGHRWLAALPEASRALVNQDFCDGNVYRQTLEAMRCQ